jgi:hypothetical protein
MKNSFLVKKLAVLAKKVENTENKIDTFYYGCILLLLMKKLYPNDEKVQTFINQIQKDLNFDLEKDNWENIIIYIPELDVKTSIGKIRKNISYYKMWNPEVKGFYNMYDLVQSKMEQVLSDCRCHYKDIVASV